MGRIKSHHFCSFISLFVGISFMFEKYVLISPSLLGPISLLNWIPGITGMHAWGILFTLGSLLIIFAPNPIIRAICLAFGMSAWAIFAMASLYASLLGPGAHLAGSFLGIVLAGLVLRFYVAIRDVVTDFTSKKKDASIDA